MNKYIEPTTLDSIDVCSYLKPNHLLWPNEADPSTRYKSQWKVRTKVKRNEHTTQRDQRICHQVGQLAASAPAQDLTFFFFANSTPGFAWKTAQRFGKVPFSRAWLCPPSPAKPKATAFHQTRKSTIGCAVNSVVEPTSLVSLQPFRACSIRRVATEC